MSLFDHQNFILDTVRKGIYSAYQEMKAANALENVGERTEGLLVAKEKGEVFLNNLSKKEFDRGMFGACVGAALALVPFIAVIFGGMMPAIYIATAAVCYPVGFAKLFYHIERTNLVNREKDIFVSLAEARLSEVMENSPNEMMASPKFRACVAKAFGLSASVAAPSKPVLVSETTPLKPLS